MMMIIIMTRIHCRLPKHVMFIFSLSHQVSNIRLPYLFVTLSSMNICDKSFFPFNVFVYLIGVTKFYICVCAFTCLFQNFPYLVPSRLKKRYFQVYHYYLCSPKLPDID